MKTFKSISQAIVILSVFVLPASAGAQQTIPTDLRNGFDKLKSMVSEFRTAQHLFAKTLAADSGRMSFIIRQYNSINPNAADAKYQHNEKYSALTAEYSTLASDVLTNAVRSFAAENKVDEQLSRLIEQTSNQSSGQSAKNLLSVETFVRENNTRAQNYLVAENALAGELGSTVKSSDAAVNKELTARQAALDQANREMRTIWQLIVAGGLADSNFNNLHGELIRMRNVLHNQRENEWIVLLPFIRWTEIIGPTLQLRQILNQIGSSNAQSQFPSLPQIDSGQPNTYKVHLEFESSDGVTSSKSVIEENYLDKARRELEKRRTINEERSEQ